jgi:exonuclease VII small subunit
MSGPGDTAALALDDAVDELERAAERLRAGDLEADEAAALVERCAELAGRLAAELERTAREAATEPYPSEQEPLL